MAVIDFVNYRLEDLNAAASCESIQGNLYMYVFSRQHSPGTEMYLLQVLLVMLLLAYSSFHQCYPQPR